MRDNFKALEAANVKVFGVSMQDAESHREFIEKYDFQFPLVVDDGTVAKAFNVPIQMGMASRHSILIGPKGNIRKIWRDVTIGTHAEDVLAALK